jgi:hypothetical protein
MSTVKFEPLVIQTDRHRITGTVAVPTVGRSRLSDYANDPERDFFAITGASISPLDAPDMVEHMDFIMVARRQIRLVMPGRAANPDA